MSSYIENKLDDEDRFFIEKHFLKCENCHQKYLEMKKIINNLHFEYEKLLKEFEEIESNKLFNIREYEMFYKNISPYIDDELNYDESIKFRKYILKSKPARIELSNAYSLKNNIKKSFVNFKDNLNINFSKKIIQKLKNETEYNFESVYKKAAILITFMLSTLIIFSIYISFSSIQETITKDTNSKIVETIKMPDDKDLIEFTLLSEKQL